MPSTVLLIYCVCIVLASLAGGWLPSVLRLTHLRMQLTMSMVAGLMLGRGPAAYGGHTLPSMPRCAPLPGRR